MFKTIIVDTWEGWAPIASFILTITIFAGVMMRAWKMKSSEADRLASLPLEFENTHPTSSHEH
ncbi:MAG: hypothetical protein ACPG32_14885 [Akkermansiaceae bacterium]